MFGMPAESFLLTTYRTKADLPSLDVKEQYFRKRTIFHNKCELKCCSFRIHFYELPQHMYKLKRGWSNCLQHRTENRKLTRM